MTELSAPPPRRPLGRSGIDVSALAWGHWRLVANDVSHNLTLAHAALDAGIDFFDTADIYGFDGTAGFGAAEQAFGAMLAAEPGLRQRLVIASKGGIDPGVPYDSSAKYLEQAIDVSLKRMAVDTIDLWQVHRPDILTHPHEIAETVERALASGKIRAFGVSNYTIAQIDVLAKCLSAPLISTQPEMSALHLDPMINGESDQAIALDLALLAWSPLAGGRLIQPDDKRAHAVAAALDTVAQDQGVDRSSAALSWLLAHPSRPIPIIGSQNAQRIKQAADALKVRWNRQSWYAVLVAARQEPLP